MGPVICLITPPSSEPATDAERIRAAAAAGVHLVQIRKPALEARDLAALVRQAVADVRGTAARVLVNDRVDVALAAGAHGVHLRGDSAPAGRVRAIVPREFVIGRSVRTVDEAARAAEGGGLDYLVFGTVFATPSKPGSAPSGLEALAAVCAAVPLPVLAVGGMTPGGLGSVRVAGAAGFAAIGLFAGGPPGAVRAIVTEAHRAFGLDR